MSSVRPRAARARRYLTPYLHWLRISDLLVVATAVSVAQVLRFGQELAMLELPRGAAVHYTVVSAVLALGWMVVLQLLNAYDGRLVGHGVQEYRQVFQASLWLFAVLAIVTLALEIDIARRYVLVVFTLGTLLLLASRCSARRWLVLRRRAGEWSDRVLVVGDPDHLTGLIEALRRTPAAGYDLRGACVDRPAGAEVAGVPVVGTEKDILEQARRLQVDVVAVSSSAGLGATGLRKLGWDLEGTDIDLVVAPGIMDVAGPRVLTRPVQGLPLIHVEAPTFSGPKLVVKECMDRVAAAIGLVLLAPLFLVVAVLIRLEDRGPVFFCQERVCREGRTFCMYKFRSMVVDAEDRLPGLVAVSDADGPLFKLRDDPRVTRVGAFLRRYSLDELPQLINVVLGHMSLVGPRPPLPREVASYESATRRRLLVKPGMTGMWQISGRSDLPWQEAVRLDLYYVENWSPILDLLILFRTVAVVLRHEGAY